MVGSFQAQRSEGQVFECFQNLRAVLQKDFFVPAVEIGEYFCVASQAFSPGGNRPHVHL